MPPLELSIPIDILTETLIFIKTLILIETLILIQTLPPSAPIVYWLGHRSFTAEKRDRYPLGVLKVNQ